MIKLSLAGIICLLSIFSLATTIRAQDKISESIQEAVRRGDSRKISEAIGEARQRGDWKAVQELRGLRRESIREFRRLRSADELAVLLNSQDRDDYLLFARYAEAATKKALEKGIRDESLEKVFHSGLSDAREGFWIVDDNYIASPRAVCAMNLAKLTRYDEFLRNKMGNSYKAPLFSLREDEDIPKFKKWFESNYLKENKSIEHEQDELQKRTSQPESAEDTASVSSKGGVRDKHATNQLLNDDRSPFNFIGAFATAVVFLLTLIVCYFIFKSKRAR